MEGTLRGSIADVLEGQISGSLELLAGEPVLENLSVSSNGVYEPQTGVDGFDKVTVNVPIPEPVLDSITINENGHYTPPAGTDGYDDIAVYVPYVSQGTTINENGTYTPPSGVDGFSQVTVNVPNTVQGLVVTENGTYTAPVGSGVVGYSPVTVNVTPPAPVTSVLNATHNGTYYPQSPSVGFSEVIVNCPESDEIILFNGTIHEPANITWNTYGMALVDGKLTSSGVTTGFYIESQSLSQYYMVKVFGNNGNESALNLRIGRSRQNSVLPDILTKSTSIGGRLSSNTVQPPAGDFILTDFVAANDECVFMASAISGTGSDLVYTISKIVVIPCGTVSKPVS